MSQRHELRGIERIYEYFSEKDVSVKVHTHDRNMSVNKLVKSTNFTVNHNDSWHGVKSVKRALKCISSGRKYKEGSSWFEQLVDKVEPIATHFHWGLRNCKEDPTTLKSRLSNVAAHYRNEHSSCVASSRCKQDPVDLRLAIGPLPPRGNFLHYDFLKLQYISHKMRHVSPLRVEALLCNNNIIYVTL